jgi:hypothetical protein
MPAAHPEAEKVPGNRSQIPGNHHSLKGKHARVHEHDGQHKNAFPLHDRARINGHQTPNAQHVRIKHVHLVLS